MSIMKRAIKKTSPVRKLPGMPQGSFVVKSRTSLATINAGNHMINPCHKPTLTIHSAISIPSENKLSIPRIKLP